MRASAVRLPAIVLLAAVIGAGCTRASRDSTPGPSESGGDTGGASGPCEDASARLGLRACVHEVPDEAAFTSITVPAGTVDQVRAGKHLAPAREDARLPTLFLDANNFPMHFDLMTEAFPDLFPGLSTSEYESLILYPKTREFYAGTLSLYVSGSDLVYGFTVWDDPADPSSTVTLADVTTAWTELQEEFGAGELSFVPSSSHQAEAASSWDHAPFPILGLESDIDYEVYNPGAAFGTVRLFHLSDLDTASAAGSFGWQDILVVDEAPSDLERIVSGIVTGTRQGELSHLNIRSAARGTPNCYVNDPLGSLAAWEGQLVRFECGKTDWNVEAATTGEAQAWWDDIRPDPVAVPTADLDWSEMPGLLDVPTDTEGDRALALSRYGAKGANLATLYQRIESDFQLSGFVIPFYYYQQFIDSGTWTVDLGDGEATHTFSETLDAWMVDDDFLSDGAVRYQRLHDLRHAMGDAPVDPATLLAVATRIREVWGGDTTMARLRSSSNAEDSLEFSGAGLYVSESACVADEYDGDEAGPSACDPEESQEQTLQHALTKVWASLWNNEAWEERAWYGIDQSAVVMGILVNDRCAHEEANAVAFTGNPTADDDRYLVDAQAGDLEVVSSDPGVWPEAELLTMEDGEVATILRVTTSSEVEDGEVVLDDSQLRTLGAGLWTIEELFPVDDSVPSGHDVLLDTEWKVLEDGRLVVKQVRTYLR
jgi:pyruvate, water dikinase